MEFKDRFKELRLEKKLTQCELAKIICFDQSAIAKWENGLRYPDINTVLLLAKFFKVSTDYLLGLDEF